MVAFDVVAVSALVISFFAFAERWRGAQRSRQETNMLLLSNQLQEIYNMIDENLTNVIRSRGRVKLKKVNIRDRFVMLQKLHIHLDSLTIMIKMEGSAFRTLLFGKMRNQYYKEVIQWYCCVHKLYNDLLDVIGIKDSSFLHDGLQDPHRTHGKPPLFLKDNKFAQGYHKQYHKRYHVMPV